MSSRPINTGAGATEATLGAFSWFPWFPLRWQASRKVQRMDLAARGLYRELLDEVFLKGSIPSDAEDISDLLCLDLEEVEPLWPQVRRCFVPHPDLPNRLTNPLMREILDEQASRSEKQRDRANLRWAKEKGTPEPDGSECGSNATVMPGHCAGMPKTGQDRTRQTGQTDTKQKQAPSSPVSLVDGVKASKKKPFPPEIFEASRRIMESWPKGDSFNLQPDGKTRVPPCSLSLLAKRLQVLTSEGADLDLLEEVAAMHLHSYRKNNSWLRAPQNLFKNGEDAPWVAPYQLLLSRRKEAEAAAKASQLSEPETIAPCAL